MFSGRVEAIFISAVAEAPMTPVQSVRAVPGLGLEGDRYFLGCGTYSQKAGPGRQITLIEAEAIDAVRLDGIDADLGDSRRNIVTRGVPLNHLVDREFTVGGVRLRGVRLCEPCKHLEEVTRKPLREPLLHRGGLRVDVISEGVVSVGDTVEPA